MKLTAEEAKEHRRNIAAIAAAKHMPDEAAMALADTLDKIIAGKLKELPKKYHFLFTFTP